MANTLLTLGGITRKAVQLFRNSNAFLKNIDRQYDPQFAKDGAKIGATLRIRLPNDYTVRSGATATAQNTTENQTTLTVSTQQGVDVSFSSVDLALSIDDFAERILEPMINKLAGAVAVNIMSGVEGVPNLTHAVDGSNNTISPTAATWLAAGALLDLNECPRDRRKIILDPLTQARTVSTLSGLFNATSDIAAQYKKGLMGMGVLGFDWFMDQTVLKHTVAAYGTLATVNGGSQTGTTLTVNALNGPLNVGDVITLAGVDGINRTTGQSTGVLQQFVVTAAAATSATSLSIYPAIVVTGTAYNTVTASPANGAAIASPTNASETYRKNFAFHPTACTLATVDLPIIKGAVIDCSRASFDGISMRMIQDYNSTTDVELTRLDILYGWLWVRPEWACIVADAL